MSNIASAPLGLDETDIAIIRAFYGDAHFYSARSEIRESISRISKRLDIAESTVRKRVGRYMKSGFVTGWNFILNPTITGESVAQVRLDILPPSAKDDVLQKLKLIEDVWIVTRYHENVVGVGVYYRGAESLRKKVELMAMIANSEHVDYGQVALPPCNHPFTATDIEIIRSIEENPRKGLASVADETRLSAKTVKRRIDRMVSERALFISPVVNFEKLRGVIAADLFVFYTSREAATETEEGVLSIAGIRAYYAAIRNPEHTMLGLFLMSMKEEDEMLAKLKKLRGIRAAYLDLVTEYIGVYQAFKDRIDLVAKQFGSRNRQIATLRA